MAEAFRKNAQYLELSYEMWKGTLDSLDSLVKACICAMPNPNSALRALLEDWKTMLLLQRCRLEESYEGSFSIMQSGLQLSDTQPLGLQLDGCKWSRLFQTLLASFEEDKCCGTAIGKDELMVMTSSTSSDQIVSISRNDTEQFEIVRCTDDNKSDDFVCVTAASIIAATTTTGTTATTKTGKGINDSDHREADVGNNDDDGADDVDRDLGEGDESVADDWSSDISLISDLSTYQQTSTNCPDNNNKKLTDSSSVFVVVVGDNKSNSTPTSTMSSSLLAVSSSNVVPAAAATTRSSTAGIISLSSTSSSGLLPCVDAVVVVGDDDAAFCNRKMVDGDKDDSSKKDAIIQQAPGVTANSKSVLPGSAETSAPVDLKRVRDRIMARFQLHQRYGHHLARDTVTEILRRAIERDHNFISKPLPYIYETAKSIMPVALESAKSKYQAPQVNVKLMAQWTFKTKLCLPYSVNGQCPNGSKCPYAHGETDLRPKRRVALCHQWEERGYCQRRSVCLYAHGRSELGMEVR